MDVALFGGKAYVTSYDGVNSTVSVVHPAFLTIEDQ